MKNFRILILAAMLAPAAWAYVVDTDSSGIYVNTWEQGTIAMQIKMPNTQALQDGTTLATSVQAATLAWNSLLGSVQFTSQITNTASPAPTGTYTNGDSINQIVMDSTYGGKAFGSGVLAVTLTYTSGNHRIESDMVFNSKDWTWDSYRGNLKSSNVIDIRRVAIHELGHVLGLNHPDQAKPPQSVAAVMNSIVSNVDTMQADDITGAQLLYGPPGVVQPNDNFANATNIILSSSAINLTGSNIAATTQTGEPKHAAADAPTGHSVWWKWTAPSSGSTTIDTLGSDFDTVLAVYTGASVTSLTTLAFNDDVTDRIIRTSAVTFNAVGGTTYCIAVDGFGSVAQGNQVTPTGAITLNLTFAGSISTNNAPTITTQPVSQTVIVGGSVTFTAAATGSPTPTFQWKKNGVNISGASSNVYSIASCTAANAGNYTVVATNSVGTATSATASLAVIIAPSSAIISIAVQ